MADTEEPPDRALVLVGHGSNLNPESSRPTYRHAAEIRRRGLFAEVREAFLMEPPSLAEVLASLAAPEAYVVPVLAYRGYIAGEVIPRRLAEASPGRRRFRLCDPVGTHPLLAETMAAKLSGLVADNRLEAGDTCLLLVGHGSARSRESSLRTGDLAATLAATGIVSEVRAAFIEQPPLVGDWTALCAAGTVVVMPFLMSGGVHGVGDVPALLGLDPQDARLRALAGGGAAAGPFAVGGRKLWYCRAVGNEPVIVDIILDRVAACRD